MAKFRRRPPARGRGLQDFDVVVQVFTENPSRGFYREEIVRESQQRDPSLSEPRIDYIRKQLIASGHIRYEAVGGPHKKRYIYTGLEWQPTPPPAQPAHRRPCEPMTFAQWCELQQQLPSTVNPLAACAIEDETAYGPLHDALAEAGFDALAEHFSTGRVHGQCWPVRILAGAGHLAYLRLTSKQASTWLRISKNQFDRIVNLRKVQPAEDKAYLRGDRIRHIYTWMPTDIVGLLIDREVVAVRPV